MMRRADVKKWMEARLIWCMTASDRSIAAIVGCSAPLVGRVRREMAMPLGQHREGLDGVSRRQPRPKIKPKYRRGLSDQTIIVRALLEASAGKITYSVVKQQFDERGILCPSENVFNVVKWRWKQRQK